MYDKEEAEKKKMILVSKEAEKKEKNIFKRIIGENWEEFKKSYPQFAQAQYEDAVKKMLGCGEEENGYACYVCSSCGNTVRVCFSCKSSFCLACGKVYTDEWMERISETLYEGMYYRHVVLTVPEDLRNYFFEDETLMAELMKIGSEMLTEVLSNWFRTEVEVGFIVVLHTAGRSGHWNPHIHIIMTSGGISKKTGNWRKLEYINYEILHKKWQEYLFAMLKAKVNKAEIHEKLGSLKKRYSKGLVAYLDKGKMPHNSQGLARYLAKYVVSPPIAIGRIINYDGKHVTYWYNDHESGKKKTDTIDVLKFIGLMVQHILPKGFQRIRYYGLHATCKRPKILILLKEILKTVTKTIRGAYKIIRKTFRQRVINSGHKDPLICSNCGDEMFLYFIWHPQYGYIYDFWENSEDCHEPKKETGAGPSKPVGNRERAQVQMLMPFMQV